MSHDHPEHAHLGHAHDEHDRGGHGHGHHRHAPASFGRAFAIGIALNTAYVVAEVVWGLMANSLERRRHFPDIVVPPWPATLRGFDDAYTAPVNGFADATEYYREASSARWVARSPVPTLVLTARDDPFIDPEPYDALRVPANVEVRITEKGGHIGFIGADGAGGWRWGERYIVEWFLDPTP